MKSFAIFQLIEKAHWVLLSAFGIFSLCSSTESTNKAITDCAALVNSTYADDAFEGINHKIEVCFHRVFLPLASAIDDSYLTRYLFVTNVSD